LSAQQKALKNLELALTSNSSTTTSASTSLLNSGLAAYQANQSGF
jgi:hypothetical protein